MNSLESGRITLAVPGGLAGQIFSVGYAVWVRCRVGKSVHLQFHDVGTSIAKFGVLELCETPTAKSMGLTYSQVEGGWPPSHSGPGLIKLRQRVTRALGEIPQGSIVLEGLRAARNEYRKNQRTTEGDAEGRYAGVIGEERLRSARSNALVVGYPTDYQIIEESWPLLSKMVAESGLPDFTRQTPKEESIAIHWRLGDYVGNPAHGTVSWSSLLHCLDAIKLDGVPIKVFTDSPKLAEETMGPALRGRVQVVSGAIWSDLEGMTRSGTFIGTNSGVSFLAALSITQGSRDSQVWLPRNWFLDDRLERAFKVPKITYGRSYFYPVGLSTKSIPQ